MTLVKKSVVPASDPSEWSLADASVCISVDVGLSKDHTAIAVMSCHHSNAAQMIGVRAIHQLPLRTVHDEIADMVVGIANSYGNPRVVVDISNQSSFLSILANRFGNKDAQRTLIGAHITNAMSHAASPQAETVQLFGQRTMLLKYMLSRNKLLENLAAELDNNMVRITQTTDMAILLSELQSITLEERGSGRAVYTSPGHDDLCMSTAMGLWCLRALGAPLRKRNLHRSGERPSSRGWT